MPDEVDFEASRYNDNDIDELVDSEHVQSSSVPKKPVQGPPKGNNPTQSVYSLYTDCIQPVYNCVHCVYTAKHDVYSLCTVNEASIQCVYRMCTDSVLHDLQFILWQSKAFMTLCRKSTVQWD